MSLAADLAAFAEANPRRKGPPCKACVLPPDLLQAARDARATKGTPFATISDWLKIKGSPVPVFTLGKHFREHERS